MSGTNGTMIGVTPLQVDDLIPQTARLNLTAWNYEPATLAVNVVADQTNTFTQTMVGASYRSSISAAKAYLQQSNYVAALDAAKQALAAKFDDTEATALREQAQAALKAQQDRERAAEWEKQKQAAAEMAAERKRTEQLKRPRAVFDEICSKNPDARYFEAHELKSDKPAAAVEKAIVNALGTGTNGFQIPTDYSVEPGIYSVMARQEFTTGVLIGGQRVVLLVVGQATDNETQIYYKVLEYHYQHVLAGPSIFTIRDQRQYTPLTPSRIQMTEEYSTQVYNGLNLVGERIHMAIE